MNHLHPISQNWGKEIYRGHDEFGPIRVFDDGNKRYLAFDSIHEQSCQHKAYPHRLMHEYTCAMLIPLVYHQPRHITLFGLGGGSLVQCLHTLMPQTQLQVVELRQRVVDVAYNYFQLPESPRIQIRVCDAGDFLPNAPAGSTEFLLCDMYHAARMDSQQAELEFIRHCYHLLADDGWISINFSHKSECTPQALNFIAGHFRDIRVCTVNSGNQILVACKKSVVLGEREVSGRARQLNEQLGFPLTKYLKRAVRISA